MIRDTFAAVSLCSRHRVPFWISFLVIFSQCMLWVKTEPTPPDGLGYLPADGTSVATNPPFFAWVPQRESPAYELRVEEDTTSSPQNWCFRTRYCLYTPETPFLPGRYRWQYRVLSEKNSTSSVNWSRPRCFVIPPDAPLCPRPSLDLVKKSIPSAHPKLLITADELARLRQGRATHAHWFDALLLESDRLAELPLMKEPRPWTGGKWNAQEWLEYYRQIFEAAHCLETLAFAAVLTQDEKYLIPAKRWLLHFASWDPQGPTSLRNNDEQAMHIMFSCARAYSWLYDQLSSEERARVRAMLIARARDAYKHLHKATFPFEQYPYNSHNGRLWHFLGEVAMALAGETPEADEWLEYALTIYYGWYPIWGGTDGAWAEGLHYFVSYHEFVLPWLWQMKKVLGIPAATKPFHHRCAKYLLAVAPPSSPLSGFGDFSENPPSPRRAWVAAGLAYLTSDELALWLAQQIGLQPNRMTPIQFLIATSLPSTQPKPKFSQRLFAFPATGLVAYHSVLQSPRDDIQWMLRASPLGNLSHSHCDQLGIVIGAFGDPLFVNTGFRDYYDSPFCREWYWHTRSHNALLIGGQGQVRAQTAKAQLIRWDDSGNVTWAVADASGAYGSLASRVERYVASLPSEKGHLIVVLDDVQTTAPDVTACWHTRTQPTLRPLASQIEFHTTNARVWVRFLSDAEIKLTVSEHYTTEPSVTRAPAYRDRHEWHIGATLTHPATDRHRYQLVTLMSVKPLGDVRGRLPSHCSVSMWGDQVVLSWQEWVSNKPKRRGLIFDTKAKSVTLAEGDKLPPSLQPPIPEARNERSRFSDWNRVAQAMNRILLFSLSP